MNLFSEPQAPTPPCLLSLCPYLISSFVGVFRVTPGHEKHFPEGFLLG